MQKNSTNADLVGFHDLLDYSTVVANGVVLLKSGALVATWIYEGKDSDTLTNNILNYRATQINSVLRRFGSGWMTHHNNIRVQSKEYPNRDKSFFKDEVTQNIDEERRILFESDGINFENVMYITLTFLPPINLVSKLKNFFIENEEKYNLKGVGDKHINYFRLRCEDFENNLKSLFKMRRLGEVERTIDLDGTKAVFDEQLEFFRFCITGEEYPFLLPELPIFIDQQFSHSFYTGLTPKIDNKFVSTIAIDGYPATSVPCILEGLERLPFKYRWSMRFIYQDGHVAISKIDKYRKKWQQGKRGFWDQLTQNYNGQINRDAVNMENEAIDAKADALGGSVLFGYFTMVIVILDEDQEQLKFASDKIKALVNTAGFTARVETGNATDSFVGSFPAHSQEDLREPLLHTLNISTILPASTIWAGKEHNPCSFYPKESPALFYAASTAGTPFRFNCHVQDVGHTLVFGPTGSGKSTLLGLMAAQARRYINSKVFVFDKGLSMLPLAYAIPDSIHYDIGGDESLGFCPFSKVKTEADKLWMEEWIITCLNLQDLKPTPRQKTEIRSAIHNHVESGDISFHDFVTNLQDSEMTNALNSYIITDIKSTAILDHLEDGLKNSDFNVFEIEELMNLGEAQALPVLLYLFWQIEKSLDGSPSFIFLDEAWIMLGHDVFKEKIKEWLKVLRKRNCIVILSTQSISDAVHSGILDVINESCPTKVYLPNPSAQDESSTALYRELGLNIREIQLLSQSTQKQDYYYRSPDGRRWFQLDLGKYTLSFVGAGGKEDIKRVKYLHETYGDEWVEEWLKEREVFA